MSILSPSRSFWETDVTGNMVWAFILILLCFLIVSLFFLTANLKLRNQIKSLKEQSRRQDLWSAFISHELRSPLSVVLMHLSLSKETPALPLQAAEHIDAAIQASDHLKALVNEILDSAQIRSKSFAVRPQWVSVVQITEDVYKSFTELAKAKNLNIQLQIEENLPEKMFLDGQRLRQILINLVHNAIKFTSKGFVKISITNTSLGIEPALQVLVSDSGDGIEKENLTRIFEPFYTANLDNANLDTESPSNLLIHNESTGLGLSIVKSLADANDWQIQVISESKKINPKSHGTTFSLIIATKTQPDELRGLDDAPPLSELMPELMPAPVSAPMSVPMSVPMSSPVCIADLKTSNLKVLIIEDLVVNRHVLKLALKRIEEKNLASQSDASSKQSPANPASNWNRMQVEETGSGQEAVNLLSTHFFNLVILDWNMPGLSGPQLLGQIHHVVNPQTTIAVISGQIDQEIQSLSSKYKIAYLLTKPVDMSILEDLINSVKVS